MTETRHGTYLERQKASTRAATDMGLLNDDAYEADAPDFDAREKETGLKVSKATLKRRENQQKEKQRKHTRDHSPDNTKRKPIASAFKSANTNFFKQE